MESTIEVLARALPKLLQARLATSLDQNQGPRAERLGGITEEVARHLNAEVCSIFLLNDAGDALTLAEAHGYAKVDASHAIHTGLTGKIFNNKTEFVLNFCVQDPDRGWAGRLDKELQTYCWSLLGVPIVSQRSGKCLGVLKFENRRKNWSTIHDGAYLRDIIPLTKPAISGGTEESKHICTAKEIARRVAALCVAHGESMSSETKHQLHYIATRLSSAVQTISFEIDPGQVSAPRVNSEDLEKAMQSIIWCANALHHQLDQVHIPCNGSLDELRQLTHAFRLAQQTYEPFTQDDLFLARALSAMIGAALDAGEAARAGALAMLRHGLKSVATEFLNSVDGTVTRILKSDNVELFRPYVNALYESAIEICGSCGVVGSDPGRVKQIEPIKFGKFVDNFLNSRFVYYRRYAELEHKCFESRIRGGDWMNDAVIPYAHGLIDGVIDCLVLNAVQFGGSKIWCEAENEDLGVRISIMDDGRGIGQEKIDEIRKSGTEIEYSERGGFGLKACRTVLNDAGFKLDFRGPAPFGVSIWIPKTLRAVEKEG